MHSLLVSPLLPTSVQSLASPRIGPCPLPCSKNSQTLFTASGEGAEGAGWAGAASAAKAAAGASSARAAMADMAERMFGFPSLGAEIVAKGREAIEPKAAA